MRLIDKKILDPTIVELMARHLKKPPYIIRHHINKQNNPIWKTKQGRKEKMNR